jgi:uroporphyrinogen decarboxylase
MNSADLIRATLAGEPTARAPFSFWTHFPLTDLDPEALARETIRFARATGIDLIKSMPNGMYAVEDWGVVSDYSEIASGGAAKVVKSPISSAADWADVKRLDETQGALGRELRHLELLLGAVGKDIPVLATAFSPLTIAKKLCPQGFEGFLKHDRAAVRDALGRIAATTRAFAARAVALGCAGVFFAVQDATGGVGAEVYAELGRPYDLDVLEGAAKGWCNAVHLHGEDVLFDAVADYPVQVLNWHIGETEPSIAAYRAGGGGKAVLGGIRRYNLTRADYPAIAEDIAAARAADGAQGVIFGPGCVIRHPCDIAVLNRVADMIRSKP